MSRRDTRLVGCGVAAFLVLIVLLGMAKFLQNGCSRYRAWREEWRLWNSLYLTWQPPLDTNGPAAWFPTNLPPYVLESIASNAVPAMLDPAPAGWQALYSHGSNQVHLSILPANASQRDKIYVRVEQAVDDFKSEDKHHKYRTKVHINRRLTYQVGAPFQQGLLWWESNYVFLAQSQSAVDLRAFLWQYLLAVDGDKPPSNATSRPGD